MTPTIIQTREHHGSHAGPPAQKPLDGKTWRELHHREKSDRRFYWPLWAWIAGVTAFVAAVHFGLVDLSGVFG